MSVKKYFHFENICATFDRDILSHIGSNDYSHYFVTNSHTSKLKQI